jgi:aryl-phospho-beta-D-glucosidase BglC (GH1 family)
MKRLGFNIVRLGIIWESVEKKEGIYDMEYLNQMEEIIIKLGKEEIFTMIDAHQDAFTRTFCDEGILYFYIEKLNYDKTTNGNFLSKNFWIFKIMYSNERL